MEFFITIALFVVIGGGACILLFKCLSSAATAHAADSEADLEDARAERLEKEADALRLQMLREKRARKRQQALPPAPLPEPAPAPQPQVVFVMPSAPAEESPARVRILTRAALPEKNDATR